MLFVTGAAGNLGREVVRELVDLDQPVRAGVLNQEEASRLPEAVEAVQFDFTQPSSFQPALQGVERVFLMRPPQLTDMDSTLNPFVDQAEEAGVQQIALVSLLGVEDNPRVPHNAAEQHLTASGVPYTLLRPSFFMQNLNTTHREEIRRRDEIFIPAGNSRTSFIDTRDIGAAAARVLTEEGHTGKIYRLTGPEALDYHQVADLFSEVLGRDIIYRDPSLPAFVWRRWREGNPLGFALVMAFLYRETRRGKADEVTRDLERLLGRPPGTLRDYVRDYAENWQES
jgi:uncharacterized protein YbjT (DUF2867 family)